MEELKGDVSGGIWDAQGDVRMSRVGGMKVYNFDVRENFQTSPDDASLSAKHFQCSDSIIQNLTDAGVRGTELTDALVTLKNARKEHPEWMQTGIHVSVNDGGVVEFAAAAPPV